MHPVTGKLNFEKMRELQDVSELAGLNYLQTPVWLFDLDSPSMLFGNLAALKLVFDATGICNFILVELCFVK